MSSDVYTFKLIESDVDKFRKLCVELGFKQAKLFSMLLERFQKFDALEERYENLKSQYNLLLKKYRRRK